METYDNVPKRVLLCLRSVGFSETHESILYIDREGERKKEREKENGERESEWKIYGEEAKHALMCCRVHGARIIVYINTIHTVESIEQRFCAHFHSYKKAHNNIFSRFSVFRQSIHAHTVCSKAHTDKTQHNEYKYIGDGIGESIGISLAWLSNPSTCLCLMRYIWMPNVMNKP